MYYSCVHKISTRDLSKNGSRPFLGRDPPANHWQNNIHVV